MIVENFRHSADDPIGLSRGVELIAVHLNLWRLLAGDLATSGSVVPAVLLLAAWAAAVVVAWRLRDQALLRLHAVTGAALVLGVVSASQILGELWYYLALWAWGIASLLVVATVWTFAAAYARRPGAAPPERGGSSTPAGLPATVGLGALVVVGLAWTAMFTNDAAHAEEPAARQSLMLSQVAPPTIAALDDDVAGTGGRDGRYLVTWTDPVAIGATGFGLLLELERQGFDVGVNESYGTGAVEHRVMGRRRGHGAGRPRRRPGRHRRRPAPPGAVEVATSDIRTEADIEPYEALKDEVNRRPRGRRRRRHGPGAGHGDHGRGHRPRRRWTTREKHRRDGRHRRPRRPSSSRRSDPTAEAGASYSSSQLLVACRHRPCQVSPALKGKAGSRRG